MATRFERQVDSLGYADLLEHPSGEEVVLAAFVHNAQVSGLGGVGIRHRPVNLVQFQRRAIALVVYANDVSGRVLG